MDRGDNPVSLLDAIARANPDYLEALYQQCQRDPGSVDERWALMFAGCDWAGPMATPGHAAGGRAAADLIHSYRELGHLVADPEPLERDPRTHPLLSLEEFGFTEAGLNQAVDATPFRGLGPVTLRELVEAL